jgi:class 3 adenylate cyclase
MAKTRDFTERNTAQAELPGGTVTFLFTDIEGSTGLLKRLGEGYADLLAEHHRLLRGVFGRYHGQEVDTQGDSIFVSYSRAARIVQSKISHLPGGEHVYLQESVSKDRLPGARLPAAGCLSAGCDSQHTCRSNRRGD